MPKPKRTALKFFPPKNVPEKHIKSFWREWIKPEKPRESLVPKSKWKRTVLSLSPTVAATVRRFSNKLKAIAYMASAKRIEKKIMASEPKHFELQPVQYISREGSFVLERVYPGPSLVHFRAKRGRYYQALKRRLKRKGIDLERKEDLLAVEKAAKQAFEELQEIGKKRFFKYYSLEANTLVLDFDPQTKKVLFALIDTESPFRSIPE